MAINKVPFDRSGHRPEVGESHRLRPNQPPPSNSFKKAYAAPTSREARNETAAERKKTDKESDVEELVSYQSALTRKTAEDRKKNRLPAPSLFDLSQKNPSAKTAPTFMENADVAKEADMPPSDNLSALEQPLDASSPGTTWMQAAGESPADALAAPKPTVDESIASEPVAPSVRPAASPPDAPPATPPAHPPSSAGAKRVDKKEAAPSAAKKTKTSLEAAGSEGKADPASLTITAFNLATPATEPPSSMASRSENISTAASLQSVADQIVDRVQIMRQGSEVSTVITLRHPPILEGATITLTACDHAKREFNIAFDNLSPEAKVLLDRRLNEHSLSDALERKGIIIHIISTSTEPLPLLDLEAGRAPSDQQEQHGHREQAEQEEES